MITAPQKMLFPSIRMLMNARPNQRSNERMDNDNGDGDGYRHQKPFLFRRFVISSPSSTAISYTSLTHTHTRRVDKKQSIVCMKLINNVRCGKIFGLHEMKSSDFMESKFFALNRFIAKLILIIQ